MRVTFLILLLANLVFLAWTQWIDVPNEMPVPRLDSTLPRLVLMREVSNEQAGEPMAGSATPQIEAPASAFQAGAAGQQAVSCVSVGPFSDLTAAEAAATTWGQQGLNPRQRAEESGTHWVDLDLGPGAPAAEQLLSPEDIRAQLEVRPCPGVPAVGAPIETAEPGSAGRLLQPGGTT